MTEADLERLIADWYGRQGADDPQLRLGPTADCPPLTSLWRHVADDHPLNEYQDHVAQCERCSRLCEIIEREHERATVAPSPPQPGMRERLVRRRLYIGTGLVAAACLALLVVGWPQPSFDAEVAAFYASLDSGNALPVRGDSEETPTGEAPQQPAWIAAALADAAVHKAIATHSLIERTIVVALYQGRLQIDPDGRLALADGVDQATAEGHRLNELIKDDRAACETIVDALVGHVPGASPKDRPRLAEALNRWRAEHVFGGG